MALSTWAANEVAAFLTGNTTTLDGISTYYLALLDTLPDSTDTGTTIQTYEPSAVSYARTAIPAGADWLPISNGVSDYATEIAGQTTEVWGTMIAYALCTSATVGEIIVFGSLMENVYINQYDRYVLPANTIRVVAT